VTVIHLVLERGVSGEELESLGYHPRPLCRRSKKDKKKAAPTERRRRKTAAQIRLRKAAEKRRARQRLKERLGPEGMRAVWREEMRKRRARRRAGVNEGAEGVGIGAPLAISSPGESPGLPSQ
jgi:hypothetical protein